MKEDWIQTLMRYTDEKLVRAVLGKSTNETLVKVKIRPILLRGRLYFQVEEFRNTQVFHKNLLEEEMKQQWKEYIPATFHQLQLSHQDGELSMLVSKKGKITIKEKKKLSQNQNRNEEQTKAMTEWKPLLHNRTKPSILLQDFDNEHFQNMEDKVGANPPSLYQSLPSSKSPRGLGDIPYLRDLGLVSKDGNLIKGKYDKFRQINRFLEFIEDIEPELNNGKECLNILDFGCGKSYLTFAIYDYFTTIKKRKVKITGLDLKADVIANCNRLAKEYQYEGLSFQLGDVKDYQSDEPIDMMVTLHACDTATDYALYRGICWGARVILSVPCCQHEMNSQLRSNQWEPLFRHGIVKERMAALMTDAFRAELLEAYGYRVQVLEFIDIEHTPKNLLLRAIKTKKKPAEKEMAWKRCEAMKKELGINPKLMELLKTSQDVTTKEDK